MTDRRLRPRQCRSNGQASPSVRPMLARQKSRLAILGWCVLACCWLHAAPIAFGQTPAAENKPAQPATPTEPKADAAPPANPEKAASGPTKFEHEGLTLTVPAGWKSKPVVGDRPMGPVALFEIPRVEGDKSDPEVRITHYPNMKGMDDANITRWVRQVRRPDGQPASEADAKIHEETLGPVRLKIVELSGTVATSMAVDANDPHGAKAQQRMIVAILDHPKGPHFVRIVGDVATMAKWEPKIQEFLHSAKAAEGEAKPAKP